MARLVVTVAKVAPAVFLKRWSGDSELCFQMSGGFMPRISGLDGLSKVLWVLLFQFQPSFVKYGINYDLRYTEEKRSVQRWIDTLNSERQTSMYRHLHVHTVTLFRMTGPAILQAAAGPRGQMAPFEEGGWKAARSEALCVTIRRADFQVGNDGNSRGFS